ncbi:MAG: radical SAM family heme chaperone HemW [Clostridia bacterium]|nr:radical SAM family heme chaperone HemW [Clostridia bacterium]
MDRSLGIYLHIPFCLRKCNYCDFCSFPKREEDMSLYVSELCRRLEAYAKDASDHTVDTIYFGGGTPTLLPIELFEKIFESIWKKYHIAKNVEVSCECNPASCTAEYISSLHVLGFNRMSIGLQSTSDEELRILGRAHSYSDFLSTFEAARRAGFSNISADLMYALPSQSISSFKRSLEELTSLCPEHISAYGLKIEEGTPFFEKVDSLSLPDEEEQAEMYLLLSSFLHDRGYEKYEISNFSHKGMESKHNLKYWSGEEYLGFGVAAHSFFGGERFGNSRDMEGFLAGKDIVAERYRSSETEQRDEYVMLSLRLAKGLDLGDFKSRFGVDFLSEHPNVRSYIDGDFMSMTDGRIKFTDKGFFVSNYILSELIDA